MRSINIVELLPMQTGQIPYTESEKNSTVSANTKERTKYLDIFTCAQITSQKMHLTLSALSAHSAVKGLKKN